MRPPCSSGEWGLSGEVRDWLRQGPWPADACTCALEFEKRILGRQPSPATGVGSHGLEGWPKALEFRGRIGEGSPCRAHGFVSPVGLGAEKKQSPGPGSACIPGRQLFSQPIAFRGDAAPGGVQR